MRLFRYIDEIHAIYKFYKQCLQTNQLPALIFYCLIIMGGLLYVLLVESAGKPVLGLVILLSYQIILVGAGYSYFRELYIDEHSPKS